MAVDWTGIGAGIGGLGSLWAAAQADKASRRMAGSADETLAQLGLRSA